VEPVGSASDGVRLDCPKLLGHYLTFEVERLNGQGCNRDADDAEDDEDAVPGHPAEDDRHAFGQAE
jgi:hypothetical protein